MKRSLIALFVVVLASSSTVVAGPAHTPCPGMFEISDCPNDGCGQGVDPELNKRKNIPSDNTATTLRSIRWMKDLHSPTPKVDFCADEIRDRSGLEQSGEGQKITVVAWALAARKGSQESCNCYLKLSQDKDNHIVLVDPALLHPTLTASEKRSVTAEFTPHTRVDHPNFTQENLESLIDPDWNPGDTATKGKLLVRVTGLLMFDSEHYCGPFPLPRKNNWEIHPVLKMEYCPEEQTCTADSDANWQNLDDE